MDFNADAEELLLDEHDLYEEYTDAQMRRRNLHQLMQTYNLNPQNIADLLGVKRTTVWVWSSISDNRDIPSNKLRMLKYKIRNLKLKVKNEDRRKNI